MATIGETDLIEIQVTGYEIQRQDWEKGKKVWKLCHDTPGYPLPESKSIPCRYADATEARARLARFRENHPEMTYRMLRFVVITESVE
jgi:hypothetical protein